jgi:hypothetical protein
LSGDKRSASRSAATGSGKLMERIPLKTASRPRKQVRARLEER